MTSLSALMRRLLGDRGTDIAVAIGVVSVILIFIIPIPSPLLDFLMILNLAISLFLILMVLYARDPLEFSIFPSVLLVGTVFGLMLNVASTRLILTQGPNFAGQVVRAFARFVVGSEGTNGLVTGLIIFIIIIIVQFLVITKGSSRISEVAARFALDAMPGKQMAIDAEFGSGAITEEEARNRRRTLEQTSDFYGRMDGASKFISGSVKASILITLTNIIGGLIMGARRGESLLQSLNTYSQLTIGDGLVSQIPTLIISIATGLVVTRAGAKASFGSETKQQFSMQPYVYYIGGAFLLLLAFVPGFPWLMLVALAAASIFLGYHLEKKRKADEAEAQRQAEADEKVPADRELAPIVPLDSLSIEMGYGLIPLVDQERGAELLDRITNIRRETALELGIVVPKIRIIDNIRLESSCYLIKLRGVEIGRGSIQMGSLMAINPGGAEEGTIEGMPTVDPAFGLSAIWITAEQREQAERCGYTVVDPPSIMATHLSELVRRNAAQILGRQDVQAMLESLKENFAVVVEEARKDFSVGEIQKILQNLLHEQVSVRNLVNILETIGDFAGVTKDSAYITEKIRQALGRQISLQYGGDEKTLQVITLSPEWENAVIQARLDTATGPVAALEPQLQELWTQEFSQVVLDVQNRGFLPIVLCSEAARTLVRSLCEREGVDVAVLSTLEVVREVKLEVIARVPFGSQQAAAVS
ncbi:flagellar biosynthesis protein FlhA [Candidatus Haliotispira prima]|uniref:Flagellar biosynthesis protein FlhA n=1 Tax=Candidatus Haliotispira prima TaxID=3034016 RepID=A0ABY8MHD1_9SPIO|nr:flagellar biosynthesis protein FlhA [Candidatus Haliotispira prima]